jgi:hypothetical protein
MGEQSEVYDPLNYDNIARSVVTALFERPLQPLPPSRFAGSGVYALYYQGDFPAYARLTWDPGSEPIYVGKAIPAGARKGGQSEKPSEGGELFGRLCEHAESVRAAENLALDHFRCRHLVVLPVWVPLAERFLIAHYKPLWNTAIEGFGNHDPGSGRSSMRRPRWDLVHPGRPWATRLRAAETAQEVLARLSQPLTLL